MNPIGMHYGFWSHNWDEIAYIPLMEKLAWLGFDICEVASAEWGYYDDARLRELKACADHNGLGITYSIGLEAKYDLASDAPAVRENGIRHVTRILESMPKVGATILNGVSYAGWQALPDHGITLDEKRRKEELALESMSRLMKVAEDCGVLYCCEVVNRFEQYLLNTAKEGVEFVKRLGSPNARVLLDTFHMNIEEDSMVDAILEAGTYAPSGMGKQSAVMVVVQEPDTIALLSRLNAEIQGRPGTDPFYGAPTVVVVLADGENYNWMRDGALVMGNLMNAAWSLGVGSCWINRALELFDRPEGKELLARWGLPATLRGVGNCILGYPEGDVPTPKPRKPDYIVRV